jgi:DNA-binding beta-propeller fold protein YncE
VFLVPAATGRLAVPVQPATVTRAGAPQPRAALVLGRTFVTAPRGDSVVVLDGGRPTTHFGSAPAALAAADFDTRLAVLSSTRRTLELYDPRTLRLVAATPAGRRPTGIASFGDLVFVADSDGDAVLAYSTQPRLHPVGRIRVPGAPYALAVDPIRRELHVTQPARNRLTTISIARFAAVSSVPTVRQPDAVAVDSATGTVAVAGHRDGLLQLVTAERRDAGLAPAGRRPH